MILKFFGVEPANRLRFYQLSYRAYSRWPLCVRRDCTLVATSPSGPRGNNELSPAHRDDYSNLLLLCPTHHALVDSNPEKWTVDKLKLMKLEHERWVSSQLEQGRIVIKPIDNSSFLDNRKREWIDFAGKYVLGYLKPYTSEHYR